tara:strand:- start:885 stop:1049 length:165 start_codon:yes stop_codon:yes gene_type:complete
MKHHVKLVVNGIDTITPNKNSKRELKRIKNEQIKEESFYKSTLGKIKAILSLTN